MAPPHGEEDVASGGRRRGRWNLGWGTLLCFQSQEASAAEGTTTTPWERSRRRRRKKRTVPVDGDLVAGTAADPEVMTRGTGTDEEESRKRKGLRLPAGCCFLAPPRAPGRERRSSMDSGGRNKKRHRDRSRTEHPRSRSDKNSSSPSEASSKIQATGGSTSNGNGDGSRSGGAEQPRGAPAETTRAPTNTKPSKTGAAGVGAFGPVVGLSVVVAVSMAGLLGGRLWVVACVCAWLAALSRLR